jgi:hypothetical protein
MSNEKSAAALRQKFLTEHAFDILNEYAQVAKGDKEKFEGTNSVVRGEVWDLTKKLVLAAKDREKLDATTKESVLHLLADGKINIQEAKELFEMLTLDGLSGGNVTPTVNISVSQGAVPTKESFEKDRAIRMKLLEAEKAADE